MTEQVTKQPTKPSYEELAHAVLMFCNAGHIDLISTYDALYALSERLEANQEAKDEHNN